MDKEEFILRRNDAGSQLWDACSKTLTEMDHMLVENRIDEIIDRLKIFIRQEKDAIMGRLIKLESLSKSLGLSEKDLYKIRSLKESIIQISDECICIDEYVINACTLAAVNESLM